MLNIKRGWGKKENTRARDSKNILSSAVRDGNNMVEEKEDI